MTPGLTPCPTRSPACPVAWRRGLLLGLSLWLALALAAPTQAHQAQTPPCPPEPPLLRWTALVRQPIGPRGLEWTAQLQAAQGCTVRLVGYMVRRDTPTPGGFLLTPQPMQLHEHADAQADDLPPTTVAVHLHPSQQHWSVSPVEQPLALQGVLQLQRQQQPDGRVFWLQLHLAADALRVAEPAQPPQSPAVPVGTAAPF